MTGKLSVDSSGRVTGPASITHNDQFPWPPPSCTCPPCWGGLTPPPACPAHGQTEMYQVRC